jgi:hypothetical protein
VANGRPLDLVTDAVAAYGIVKLRNAYAGNCIRVINASAVTLDIPFNAAGLIDTAILDAHLAGADGTVDVIYDHTTNALDAAQTTAANRPAISVDTINGIRCVVFNSIFAGTNPAQVSKFMSIPVGLSQVPRAASVIAVGQTNTNAMTSTYFTLGPSNNLVCTDGSNTQAGSPTYAPVISCNGTGAIGVVGTVSPAVYIWNPANNVNSSVSRDNTRVAGITMGQGAGAVTTGAIGNASAPGNVSPATLFFGGLIIYPTPLTQLQFDTVRGSLSLLFNIAPQITDTLMSFGDSICAGQGAINGRNRHNQSLPLESIPLKMHNMGVSGIVLGPVSNVASVLARQTNYQALAYVAGARNFIVSQEAGINDLGAGARTAAQIELDVMTFFQKARALGSNVRCIDCTILPSLIINSATGSAAETQRLALNDWKRANWPTYCDALCDFASNPIMGPPAAILDATLYVDSTHPTGLGYSYLANQHQAVVNSMLQ